MRFLVRICACLLVGIVAVLGVVVPAQAAEPAPAGRVAAVSTHNGATCDYDIGGKHDVVLAVPQESLGGGLTCDEVKAEIRVGEPSQQAGPHSSSTTWSWEICIFVWGPNGTIFKWCLKITITTSTTVPGGDGDIDVTVLRAEHGSSPLKICWDEELRNGEIATHCIEITIDAGDPDDD